MTTTTAAPSPLYQWWVLSARTLIPAVRGGELVTALVAPLVFTVGFYVPLQRVIALFTGGAVDYGQFLMPLIALQAVAFTAISAAFLAATDAVHGIDRRFATMPIAAAVPLAARLSASTVKCALSLAAAIGCGYVIGFRFAGATAAVGFCVLALTIGTVLTLGADVLGTVFRSPEATTQALMLPQLVLGMLSCGFVPIDQFPAWIQPFARNQPVSQFASSLRGLADGTGAALTPTLLWLGGILLVVVPLATRTNRRQR
ncbi:ABC transporter permease [Rhodococcus ruber]|uniref:Doxorubicin resistance ABC transporter permease protein DrrB n=1 Tax=Rhodococcus ruber TaxID=1830 RepID=A0A098BMQ2_9NOCA|nr:ABC transporter permease [Rhodococcus ruber]MCD2127194.1 ABC transporter permease [Rhodococcus ruber]MCZ4503208.1 ABC transporter permease [Rhodococcus ruber]MCZ4530697.1 ABC transporter permease [Rhodococcus ruber]MCZ4621603.1 ABC transporter permease [Rhodococcus ruber]MDI9971196.1 ABC transporter permease [Rhodococcus ruber]